MAILPDGRFQCDICFGIFDRHEDADERALKEMRATFGEIPEDQRSMVCDDCYEMLQRMNLVPGDEP